MLRSARPPTITTSRNSLLLRPSRRPTRTSKNWGATRCMRSPRCKTLNCTWRRSRDCLQTSLKNFQRTVYFLLKTSRAAPGASMCLAPNEKTNHLHRTRSRRCRDTLGPPMDVVLRRGLLSGKGGGVRRRHRHHSRSIRPGRRHQYTGQRRGGYRDRHYRRTGSPARGDTFYPPLLYLQLRARFHGSTGGLITELFNRSRTPYSPERSLGDV